MESRSIVWEALWHVLSSKLSQFGQNDALGHGSYWLVDDDWGGRHQKICVMSKTFWSASVEEAIRDVLRNGFQDWGVYVVFEDGSGRHGFIVYFDRNDDSPRWD